MPLDIIEELTALVDAIEAERIDYAVCGGIAVAIHGHPRATKDIDMLVMATDVDAVMSIAKSKGFDVPSRKMVFRMGHEDEHHMQRVSKLDESGNLLSLDLLIVGPVHQQAWDGRERAPWRTTGISVVSREGLATMKRRAGRPQDLADLAALEAERPDDEQP